MKQLKSEPVMPDRRQIRNVIERWENEGGKIVEEPERVERKGVALPMPSRSRVLWATAGFPGRTFVPGSSNREPFPQPAW